MIVKVSLPCCLTWFRCVVSQQLFEVWMRFWHFLSGLVHELSVFLLSCLSWASLISSHSGDVGGHSPWAHPAKTAVQRAQACSTPRTAGLPGHGGSHVQVLRRHGLAFRLPSLFTVQHWVVLLNGCEQIVHQSHLSCLDFLAFHLVQPLLKHLTHLNTVDTLFHFVTYGLTLTHDSVTIALDVNV